MSAQFGKFLPVRMLSPCSVPQSCLTLCDPMDPTRLLCPRGFPGMNAGMGCRFLLQGTFPIQGSNLCLLHLLRWQVGSFPLAPPGKPKNAGVGSLSLLQGIFPPQGSNLGLLHGRHSLHHLSLQGTYAYTCVIPKRIKRQ